jgi:ATP-dependent Clp protease ATP-binding subunit ClpC
MLHVPVMVSVDKRGVHDLLLPGISSTQYRGVSLAELLDDVALDLMERVPQMRPARLAAYRLCPHMELRRVKITVRVGGTDRKPELWTGRLTVVLTRWPAERFHQCTLPRLGPDATFAVRRTSDLQAGLSRYIAQWIKRHGLDFEITHLEALVSRGFEYLEVLEVDTDLPTVLPSRPAKRKKRKKTIRGIKARQARKKRSTRRRVVPPITLRQVGVDLTHRAIDGRLRRTFGRDALVARLLRQLDRPGAAILLVGPSGVGKTAIVHEVVRRLAALGKPLHLRTDVWSVDGNRIIAGMSMVGAWEQRCKGMVTELEARDDVLYVDDLPSLVYTGRSRSSDTNVAEYLEPHIARGDIRIIGECTVERLEAVREEAPGFFSRFQVVRVPELDDRQTLMVLVDTLRAVEARERVVIEPEVLEGVLALTERFMRRQAHPGKAVSLLEQLVTDYAAVDLDDRGRRIISRTHLVDYFARRTGLPSFVLWEQQSRPHAEVLAHFERRIIGQIAASSTAADIVCVLQQGLDDPDRPLATLLFVGPTGVGKTETAKALAAYLFGSADRLIRFDMSEFRDPASTARLFGDRLRPDGELTRRVAQQPFSVVLFDEIEKAHPRVFDAFLQVFGEGRLTNAAGRTTDFCSTILIMTSNLGVAEADRGVGFTTGGNAAHDQHYRRAAEGFFRPEFFNRIDRVVPFRSLARADLGPLVQRTLEAVLSRRGLRRSGVMVEVSPELVTLLVDQGFDPRYGARSLRRAIEQRLTVPLARQLVSQPVDRTTLVQLYRFGADIGLSVWSLQDAEVRPPTRRPVTDWQGVRARTAEVTALLDALLSSAAEAALADERATLIERANARRLDDAGWARLATINGLFEASSQVGEVDSIPDLRRHLEQMQQQWLDRYAYVEEVHLVGPAPDQVERESASNRRHAIGADMPLTMDRRALNKGAITDVQRSEAALAVLSHRVHALASPAERYLLRVLPGTDAPESRAWARALADALALALRRWGAVQRFERQDGAWQAEASAPSDAHALLVSGFLLAPIVLPELGFHLRTEHSGPDLICALARVERVVGDEPPVACLTAADAQYAAFRAARSEGESGRSPRPQLPVVRRFHQGASVDPATGVTLAHPLDAGLYQVALARLLEAHQ